MTRTCIWGKVIYVFSKSIYISDRIKNKNSVKTKPNYKILHFCDKSVCWQTEMTDLLKRGQKILYNFVSYICISHHVTQDTQALPKSNIPLLWATISFPQAIGLTLSAGIHRTELSLRKSERRGAHRSEVPTEFQTVLERDL